MQDQTAPTIRELTDQLESVRVANARMVDDFDRLTTRNALLERQLAAVIQTSESVIRDKDRLLTELDGANALADAQAKDLDVLEKHCTQRTQWMHTWLNEHQGELLSGTVSSECVATLIDGFAHIADGTYAQWLEQDAVEGQNVDPDDHVHVEEAQNPTDTTRAISQLFAGLAGLLQSSAALEPGAKLTFEFVKD